MSRQVHAYEKVSARIAADIAHGRWPAGSPLPGEHALAREFQVSRGTVRQALEHLRRDRMVSVGRQGAGTFVTYDRRVLTFADGLTRSLEAGGIHAVRLALRNGVVVRDPALGRRLGVVRGRFIAFDRIRRLPDGLIISLEESRVPLSPVTASLVGLDVTRTSLVAALAALGLVATDQDLDVEAAPLPESLEALVPGLPEGRLLRLTRRLTQADGTLVEFVTTWLHPSHFHLHVEGPLGVADTRFLGASLA